MTIRELYAAAIEQKEESLLLLLDLLFAEKRIKFDDDVKVLDEYFKDCYHVVKMNEYLSAHNELRRIFKAKEYVEVFNIKSNKGRCFIAAQTKEQALVLFQKAIGGEVYSIHAEPLELGVFEQIFREEPKEKTWHKVLTKVKKIPSIIGYYDY